MQDEYRITWPCWSGQELVERFIIVYMKFCHGSPGK
jgi:hypothetical protein